jgi:hypothetical protein
MPVERVGDFLEFHDLGITPSLGIESEHLTECVSEVTRRGWLGAFGCPTFGFNERDLNFLHQLPNLVQVWFWNVSLENIEGLYALKGLKYFGVHEDRPEINFSKFPGLETMVWFHKKKDSGIEGLSNLKMLNVWHFKPRSKSFEDLLIPSSLKELGLFWANPETLIGLPRLPLLERLEIHRCRSLKSLESLYEIAPNLETLIISTSGKLDVNSLPQELNALKTIRINNRVIRG